MAWDFEPEPEYKVLLEWADEFVSTQISQLDVLWPHDVYKPLTDQQRPIVERLKQAVRDRGLWACHLEPELGGGGYGQLALAQLNEILGKSLWASRIFGTQAPDTGNAEIIAHFGTREQKDIYLTPLLNGDIFSCYSMTEPQGGADPGVFTTAAVRDGEDWVINGLKFFSTNARWASFYIVMAVTDPQAPLVERLSMFLVPADTRGVRIEDNFAHWTEPIGEESEGLVSFTDVRLPSTALLGDEGGAFTVAQVRLGGGRVHHSMRGVGLAQLCLDMMAERALSRTTKGTLLAEKQSVQAMIADSYLAVQQFRLLTLYTAWKIDNVKDYNRVRKDIAAIKIQLPRMLQFVAQKAIQIHGALGITPALPLTRILESSIKLGIMDGPTEVHVTTLARQLLREYSAVDGLWPSEYIPEKRKRARRELLGEVVPG